jgi:hypothetical protein
MTQAVIHQPRVAWDGARAFVRAAGGPHAERFALLVLGRLGEASHAQFVDSRNRLLKAIGGDRYTTDLEAGKWRVRLDDLMQNRPDLIPAVLDLTNEAREL